MVISSSPRSAAILGHGDRVGDVGFAGAAQLALVGVDGRDTGAADEFGIAVGVVLVEPCDRAAQSSPNRTGSAVEREVRLTMKTA